MLQPLTPYISFIIFAVVLLQLVAAVYLDLITAKFPNKFFVAYLVFNLILCLVLRGLSNTPVMLITLGVAVLLLAPIYIAKILGGGDIKLILSVSPLLLMDEFIGFLLMSFVWAGLFGLIKSLIGGNLRALLLNTLFAAKKVTVAENGTPFTVGILLGWCSYKTFLGLGVL